ncbi:hypothetical protein ZEAMMB73_Zm00001d040390 [Zea mays]|uniref:Uncharacterized protein n=1 Tax=Zea mays TaxID=4577 RepID=A0A1D6MQI9_MAIZE|nr:hypothetical protein ZEAMMB73_Zm00001d040390 [Zea mays]
MLIRGRVSYTSPIPPFNVVSVESSTSYSEQGHTDERRDDMDFSHSSIRFCALIMVWSLGSGTSLDVVAAAIQILEIYFVHINWNKAGASDQAGPKSVAGDGWNKGGDQNSSWNSPGNFGGGRGFGRGRGRGRGRESGDFNGRNDQGN